MSITLIAIVAIVALLYYITTKNFNYWKKKNVPYPTPIPLFGNYLKYILLQKSIGEVNQELCQKFKKEPYFGTYFGTEPALVVLDPEMIKLVYSKDFYFFNSRELMDHRHRESMTQNLFFQCGDDWKIIRTLMTPVFTSAKLKNMFYLLQKCCYALEDMLEYETKLSKNIKARELMIRYTMDCICSCMFGIETGTMGKNPENNPFTSMGTAIFGNSYFRGFCTVTRQMWPRLLYGVGLRTFPKEIDVFFDDLVTNVFKSRDYTPTQRHDFVDHVLGIYKKNRTIVAEGLSKNGVSKKVTLDFNNTLMVMQCTALFAGGFETSAGVSSLTIYELAKNKKAQKRAQEEIDEYLKKRNNKISDDCITELPFLAACVSETLRLYPVVPVLTREAVEDYRFPNGLFLEKGMRVHLPVYHIHRDPDAFPDPEQYKPERFMPDAEHPIKPNTYFPYGEGPRTCIGMRFSKLQVIPGLITFFKTYNVTLTPGTPEKLNIKTTTLLFQPDSLLPVTVEKRPDWEQRVYAR